MFAEQFELDEVETGAFRDFVVTTARDQFKVGNKTVLAGHSSKCAKENDTSSCATTCMNGYNKARLKAKPGFSSLWYNHTNDTSYGKKSRSINLQEISINLVKKVGQVTDNLSRLGEKVDHLAEKIDQRFDTVDQRFDTVDQRFDTVDQRFDTVDQRFDTVDQRFDTVDQRFDGIDTRLGNVERKVDGIATDLEDLAIMTKWDSMIWRESRCEYRINRRPQPSIRQVTGQDT